VLSFPPFRLDLQNERLWKDSEEVRLRRKPFAILRHLVEHPQRLVTHEEIVDAVWGKVAMSESLLRTHLSALREALGDGVIETVFGRGYRFLPEVKHLNLETPRADATSTGPRVDGRLVVARDDELDSLRTALRWAKDGGRSTVFVTGEAGTGKTTLVDIFLEQAKASGPLLVGRGACVEQYGGGQAYLPVLDAVGALCREQDVSRVIDVFTRYAPTWLVQIPGVVDPHRFAELQRRAAGATQARTMCELAVALEALSAGTPVVVLLEDLHWADASTSELLAFLGRRREPAQLLILGTYRPEESPRGRPLARVTGELIAHRQASAIALQGLGSDAVDLFVSKRCPGHTFPPELARTLERSSGGNPLFLATLVDDLESQGIIRQRQGRWELATTVPDVAARRPESIRRLIDAQIDRLGALEQRIIEVAAIAGMTFTAGIVAHALEADPDGVDSTCESLANERRMLEYATTESWPDGTIQSRYAFRHALFQHAALARSTAATARAVHRRIAERVEEGYVGREDEVVNELAVHFEEGQVPAKAAYYHVAAGERAAGRCGHEEAIAHHEQARALLERTPEGQGRDVLELRNSLGLGWSRLRASADMAVPSLERAKELAARLGDKASLGKALIFLELGLLARGDVRGAAEQAHALAPVVDQLPEVALRILARQVEATTALLRGQFKEARRQLGDLGVFRAMETKTEIEAAGSHLLAFSMGTFALWLTGEPDRAVALSRHAQRVAAQAYDPVEQAAMLGDGALLHAWRREPMLASELARRAVALSDQGSSAHWRHRAELILRWAEAELSPTLPRDRVEELSSPSWGSGSLGGTMHAMLYVAMCARLGRAERALEVIASTLAAIERTDERWLEPEFHRLRGEILRSRNDAAQAEQSLATAVDVARKQGSRSLELRAALSVHAFASGAKKKRARENVARLLSVITEGHDTPDLLDARNVVQT
jgi:predicted ATPase